MVLNQTKDYFLDIRTKEHKIELSGGSIAQPLPLFKGDLRGMFSLVWLLL